MISQETTGKVTIEGKFPYTVCRRGVRSKSTYVSFSEV